MHGYVLQWASSEVGREGMRGEGVQGWTNGLETLARGLPGYLVAIVCGVMDPLPDITLVFHGDGSYSSFGGRSGGHAELNVHMTGKSGRHFPVRAKFKVAEETVWMTRSYKTKTKNPEIRFFGEAVENEPPGLTKEAWKSFRGSNTEQRICLRRSHTACASDPLMWHYLITVA